MNTNKVEPPEIITKAAESMVEDGDDLRLVPNSHEGLFHLERVLNALEWLSSRHHEPYES